MLVNSRQRKKFQIRQLSVATLLLALALFLVNPTATLQAQYPNQSLQQLRDDFKTLRNRDPQTDQQQRWRSMAQQLESRVQRKQGDAETQARALLDAAVAYHTLYEKYAQASDRTRSTEVLERISNQYRQSSVADDALYKLWQWSVKEPDLSKSPESYAQRLRAEHPASEFVTVLQLDQANEGEPGPAQKSGAAQNAGTDKKQAKKGKSSSRAKTTPTATAGRFKVVLDPGHGGEDLGAEAPGGLFEKDIVLDIAFKVADLLRESGADVSLTRTGDEFVPLTTRTEHANQFNADLFISLHINASGGGKQSSAAGIETYYLDTAGDESSTKLAERENKAGADANSVAGGGDLAFLLSDLIQSGKTEDSVRLARYIQRNLIQKIRSVYPGTKDRGVKRAPFFVLVGAHMPCVLVELFFIDNPEEANKLSQPEFRKALAQGLFEGIREVGVATGKLKN